MGSSRGRQLPLSVGHQCCPLNVRAASGQKGQRTQTFSDSEAAQGAVTLRMEDMARNTARSCLSPASGWPRIQAADRYAIDVSFSVFN